MSTCRLEPTGSAARAGATAAAAPEGADDGPADGLADELAKGSVGGACGIASGSRISALSPLPNAFLVIGDDLLCELNIAFGAFTTNVVEDYRLSVAWSFRQPHVPWDHSCEDLRAKKTSEICGNLFR